MCRNEKSWSKLENKGYLFVFLLFLLSSFIFYIFFSDTELIQKFSFSLSFSISLPLLIFVDHINLIIYDIVAFILGLFSTIIFLFIEIGLINPFDIFVFLNNWYHLFRWIDGEHKKKNMTTLEILKIFMKHFSIFTCN